MPRASSRSWPSSCARARCWRWRPRVRRRGRPWPRCNPWWSGTSMKPRRAAEQSYRGEPASPGLAMGALVRLAAHAQTVAETVASASAEKVRLETAIARAKGELSALIAANDAMGADILEFQRELLDDAALAEAAFAAIAGGAGAATAWRTALDEQIATYERAEDDYFRARAGDLADLRDRVVTALTGTND